MLGLICGMLQQGKLAFSFKFAIFVSSYRSRSKQHQEVYGEKIMIPTLHVYGEADQVIQQPMSIEFLEYFHEPKTIVHPGGHFIPATGSQKQHYIKFMEEMKQICL
ncbi:unnamed protein product [Meganyctiphanes norvegica]|uniref:Serine hydrolase domain-containing protein n=1 Tax=Meganyctiphanes norvegica TaxID=48144 RepID=A0AAV2QLC9_MEGNR